MNSMVVLISGRGSNMQALVEAGLPVAAVISNRADAAGLAYATALPVTEREWKRLLTLPLFPALTDDEVNYIIETIRRYHA